VLAYLHDFAFTIPINNISLEKTGCASEWWSTYLYSRCYSKYPKASSYYLELDNS